MAKPLTDERSSFEFDRDVASANVQAFLQFLSLIEKLEDNAALYEAFLHPDIQFIEYPNPVNKQGQTRGLQDFFEGMKLAKTTLLEQRYDIIEVLEAGDKLVIECRWSGTMAKEAGSQEEGQKLLAYICMIIICKEGKIVSQRSYNCYEAF